MEDEDINIFKDKVESLIVQDHKYTLDKVDNIIESLNKQLIRKDIIIVILIICLFINFAIHLIGYYNMPPIKNQVIQTDSEGNIIKIINSEDGDINVG